MFWHAETVRRRSAGVVIGIAVLVAVVWPGVTLSARVSAYGYVTSSLVIPQTPEQAKTYGRDIDGDGHVDNAFGQFLAALAAQNLDFQLDTTTAIQDGKLLMLQSLRTRSWKKTKKATWQVLFAKASDAPKFDGTGTFHVDGSAPSSRRLRATIRKHHVKTKAGDIPIELELGGMVTLRLKSAVISATCSRSGCSNGRVSGVITKSNLDNQVIPQLAVQFSAIVARDCPGPGPGTCADNSAGKTLQALFDSNSDLVISSVELAQSPLMQTLLAPDIDLNHDGKRDALSIGLGFETVRAKLLR